MPSVNSREIDGVLLVDKAPDMTSHDVVAIARKCLGMKKIGHCGTLDPMATGLLILVLGRATKVQNLLMAEDKEYEATLTLGSTTHSQDSTGEVLETKPVPAFSDAEIAAAFAKYDGDYAQLPPMVSAKKIGGVRLHEAARKGEEIEREPRVVHVYHHELKRIAIPHIDFRVVCSKGFYVRTYCHDIGQDLGCGAHMSALRRTRSGNFHFGLNRYVTVDQLKSGDRDRALKAMLDLPEVSLLRGA